MGSPQSGRLLGGSHTRRPTIRNTCAGEEALAWPHNLLLVPQKDPKARGLSRDQDVSCLQWPPLSVTAWLQAPTDMHPFHMQNALTLSNTQSPETQLELDTSIGKQLKSGLPAAFQAGSSRAKCWGCERESGSAPRHHHPPGHGLEKRRKTNAEGILSPGLWGPGLCWAHQPLSHQPVVFSSK